MEEKDNKKDEKYGMLASHLDDRSAASAGDALRQEEEARKLVFLWDECHPADRDTEEVWNKTLRKIKAGSAAAPAPGPRKGLLRAMAWGAVAATVALLVGAVYFFRQTDEPVDERQTMEQLMMADTAGEEVKEVTLVSDEKKIEIADNALVAYTQAGQVSVNSGRPETKEAGGKTEKQTVKKDKDEAVEYDRIIVPKGRRSMIVLSDDSKIWINSDSRLIYPRSFKGGKRQIFVEGEAYLKVARDETRPFVVNTSACSVEVLGTSFNISARKGSTNADVVLVEGAVDVTDRQERRIQLKPNERLELTDAGITKKETVNALDYIHWVDGVWVLDGKPLKEVVSYLTDYYGQPLSCDSAVEEELFYGKLFLNEDLDKVLESIRQSLPASSASKGGIIFKDSI